MLSASKPSIVSNIPVHAIELRCANQCQGATHRLPTPLEHMKSNGSSPSWFGRFARWTSHAAGSPIAFIGAFLIIVVWVCTGPLFGYSDTWQLVINTGTTIVTFLMVFLIQSTQNRDSAAVQVKLSELIRAVEGAHTSLASLEDLDEEQLAALQARYASLAKEAKAHGESAQKKRREGNK